MAAWSEQRVAKRKQNWHDLCMRYKTGSSTKHRVKLHIVWCPKYRRRVLKGAVKRRIIELMEEASEINGWEIEELAVQEDHVHIFIQISPRDRISEVVQRLKGGSSRKIREEYPELEEFLWGDSLWGDGYFVETIGDKNERIMKEYIRSQR